MVRGAHSPEIEMPAPVENRLLASLSIRDRQRVLRNCEGVELGVGETLLDSDQKCRYVYFPTDSFISLVAALGDRARLGIGIVGDEGMIGTSLILGVNIAPLQAIVQGAGGALRMSAASFRRELDESPALRRHMNGYVHVLFDQLGQTAICTRFHVVEVRLARWLLMTRDRAHSNQFHLTHEFLARMLGVRRVGITKAASSLERRGVIGYHRGKITVLDPAALEEASCSCYRLAKDSYEQTLGNGRVTRVVAPRVELTTA
jgi:CRP-like cAMP-binding protein